MKTTIYTTKKNYINIIRVGYDKVEQIREGEFGVGLEDTSGKRDRQSCVQSKLEYPHGCSGHNFLWQFAPVWDYLNAERMLAATGLTPLLLNLESMTSKPNVGGGIKVCVTWKVDEAMHYFVYADKVNTYSSTD